MADVISERKTKQADSFCDIGKAVDCAVLHILGGNMQQTKVE